MIIDYDLWLFGVSEKNVYNVTRITTKSNKIIKKWQKEVKSGSPTRLKMKKSTSGSLEFV